MEALAWIDVETNGLDPKNGYLLEVAIIVTDMQLNELGRLYSLGCTLGNSVVQVINTTDQVVIEMHDKSLLWKDLMDNFEFLPKTEHQIDEYLGTSLIQITEINRVKRLYPAGSSVHFDIDWLRAFCPITSMMFSHRHLDLSSIKLMNQVATGVKRESSEETPHRAMADIEKDITWFKELVFPLENISAQATHIGKQLENEN
jgi:oligoribonuclease